MRTGTRVLVVTSLAQTARKNRKTGRRRYAENAGAREIVTAHVSEKGQLIVVSG